MQHQLELWPPARQAPCPPGPWEGLSPEEQAEMIALLGRLIAQAVCPQRIVETQEKSHEP
jgi:hypothetical protein